MKFRVVFGCGLSLLAACVLCAQTAGSFSGTASFGPPPPFAAAAVAGAPYSGQETNERVQTLADGTHITQTMPGRKVWRDTQGRIRAERPLFMGPSGAGVESPTVIEITDPVAGFQYTLDTANKVAHRQVLPAPGTRGFIGGTVGSGPMGGIVRSGSMTERIPAPGVARGGGGGGMQIAAPGSGSMSPKMTQVSLGTQTIDGVSAEGTLTTTTYPVGLVGNDREFPVTMEAWVSPELKIQVLSKSIDPRSGNNTFEIQNLSRTAPDPSLFVIPAGYTVVDETGAFSITYKSP